MKMKTWRFEEKEKEQKYENKENKSCYKGKIKKIERGKQKRVRNEK